MILRDPVHDLVSFEAEEEDLIPELLEASEVQRLRRIRQLGVTNLVFPGAEHSRFTHAIGAAHVMKRWIRRLREIDHSLPFWQRLASDRAREALAAALLHDVGHGPYSHLFEEALPRAIRHEAWSLRVVLDPSTDVNRILTKCDPSLPERVASLIDGGDGSHVLDAPTERIAPAPLPYLAHAVSGTFDVDRCDYLLRDAAMTGVRYGLYDLDWLLRSLRFGRADEIHGPRFAIDGMKGLPAIEGFLLARRFMFEQVYLHKATRAAETLVKAIFARTVKVIEDGIPLSHCPNAIECTARGDDVSLASYLELDDGVMAAAFVQFEHGKDRILADLCARLRARRIPKTIELFGENAEGLRQEHWRSQARDHAITLGLDPDAHVAIDVAEHELHLGGLEVVFGDNSVRPLGEVSPLLAKLCETPIRRVRLIVAPEIRDRMRDIPGRFHGSTEETA